MKKLVALVLVLVLVLAVALGVAGGAGAESELYGLWGMQPDVAGYKNFAALEEKFGYSVKNNIGAIDAVYKLSEDEINIEMFGYAADVELRLYGKGITVLFDGFSSYDPDVDEIDDLMRYTADQYNAIVSNFVAAYDAPTQIQVRHSFNDPYIIDYADGFDIFEHLKSKDGLPVEIRTLCNNVEINLTCKAGPKLRNLLTAATTIKYYAVVLQPYESKPEPTPKPTNIPVEFE